MSKDRVIEAIVEALKQALSTPGEHRLYKSGKLEGLFAGRTGVNGEAATRALREGLFEVVRIEPRGKTSWEWVRLTPQGVDFLHGHESPVQALHDLRDVLRANREAVPLWLADMRQELHKLGERLQEDAHRWLEKLETLGQRVEETLARLEKLRRCLPDELTQKVPWAPEALDYLDRRQESGAGPACALPELFEALRRNWAELSLPAFHDGLRRLQDRRALRLLSAEDGAGLPQPEYALFDGARVFYSAAL
jgi:hypothetical protein